MSFYSKLAEQQDDNLIIMLQLMHEEYKNTNPDLAETCIFAADRISLLQRMLKTTLQENHDLTDTGIKAYNVLKRLDNLLVQIELPKKKKKKFLLF